MLLVLYAQMASISFYFFSSLLASWQNLFFSNRSLEQIFYHILSPTSFPLTLVCSKFPFRHLCSRLAGRLAQRNHQQLYILQRHVLYYSIRSSTRLPHDFTQSLAKRSQYLVKHFPARHSIAWLLVPAGRSLVMRPLPSCFVFPASVLNSCLTLGAHSAWNRRFFTFFTLCGARFSSITLCN